MKKLLSGIMSFISENKKEPWFRYVAIIVVMLIIALGINKYHEWQDEKEAEAAGIVQTEEEKEQQTSLIEQFWDTSKAHFVMFGILTVLLIIVKYKKSVKLEERGGYKEKKNE